MSAAERAELARRIEQERIEAQAETERRHADAAARALRIWTESAPANPNHPYLLKKQIQPGISRQHLGALVLPIQDFTGQLWGLQFIQPDGSKRFLSGMKKTGCYIPIGGRLDDSRAIYLVEGWATGMTIQAMKPTVQVAACCDAGNLASVATEGRRRWPALSIVVCPDFDSVGRQKGQEAAEKARALILPPPARIPEGASDWNDVAAARRQGVAS
jgi:putative DNA primase/helicase